MQESAPQVIPPAYSTREVIRNLTFIVAAVGTAYAITIWVGIENLRGAVGALGIYGPLAVLLVKVTTIIVAPLGGGPVYAVAGAVFGFWEGFLITFIGDVLGFTIAFYLSRVFGRSIVGFFLSRSQMPLIEKVFTRTLTLPALVKARITFMALPEGFAYAAGLTLTPFPLFITLQMLFHVPNAMFLVLFGDAIFTENPMYVIAASVGAVLIAAGAGWWFHKDLLKEG